MTPPTHSSFRVKKNPWPANGGGSIPPGSSNVLPRRRTPNKKPPFSAKIPS